MKITGNIASTHNSLPHNMQYHSPHFKKAIPDLKNDL